MFSIGSDIQAGLIFVSFSLFLLITVKCLRSGVPRFRVIFLMGLCFVSWVIGFFLTLMDKTASQSLLWELVGFLGMVSTIFMFFIASYEIISTPWL